MKPKKLIMSAFGSYADKTVIDFDGLGDKGIYLICGDTGSGKTTIFDAISFALYGEASGNVRKASMFRSLYADPKTETFVELQFQCNEKLYTVKRSPQYERAKLRGQGRTVSPPACELFFPKEEGKPPLTGVKEVNNEIYKIIGIDRNQFSQIAMIAQGDFQKLILSDTNERRNIFRKLFGTEIYDKIQQKMSEKNSELKNQFTLKENAIKTHLEMFSFLDNKDTEVFRELPTLDEKTEFIKDSIKRDQEEMISLKKLEGELEERKTSLTAVIDHMEDEIDKQNRLELLKKQGVEKAAELEVLRNYVEEAETHITEKEALIKERNIIEKGIDKYDALDSMTSELEELERKLSAKEESFKKLKADVEKQEEGIKKGKALIDSISELEKEMTILTADSVSTEKNIAVLESIKSCFVYNTALVEKFSEASLEYEEALKKYNDSKEKEIRLERLFITGQAGIIAGSLRENQPCPVCGSTVHPVPAKLHSHIPHKTDVDKAKEESLEYMEVMNEKNAVKNNIEGQLENNREQMKKLIDDAMLEPDIEKSRIELMLSEENKNLEKLLKRQAEISPEIQKRNSIEEKLPILEKKFSQSKALIKDTEKAMEQLKIDFAAKESTAKAYASELKFPNRRTAEKEMKALELKAEKLDTTLKNAQKKYNNCKVESEKLISSMETLRKTMKNIDISEKDSYIFQRSSVMHKLEDYRESLEIIKSRIRENTKNLEALEQVAKEAGELEANYREADILAKTLTGNLKQKTRLSLETYVQASYFDNIIKRANKRLLKMTNAQFELIRAKDEDGLRSQSGLGLDVIDHFCNSTRSIKTLSGGESFKASLALALGLSDEIQANAGGIRLETMFIDEGFGTLDDESLESAMQAFNSLIEGNKLIGIISHVSDLKSRIDKQIVVKKNASGGSSAYIIT